MADEAQKPVDGVRVVMPKSASPSITNIADLFARQVTQRCAARVVTSGDAPLVVELALAPGIGAEGFRIEDRPDGGVRIAGNDERGVLYGAGKFLRTSRYDQGGFSPGWWRGTSVPQKPVRGIYFATHFHNFYHDAPVEKIQRYVEDLGLWGYNVLIVWYDMHHFDGFDDPKAVAFRARLHAICEAARRVGLDVGFGVIANEAYNDSPLALRADPSGQRGGWYDCAVCPSKPGGMEYALRVLGQEFDWCADLQPRYVWIWPYDQGGCGCGQCRPWGNNGFLRTAERVAVLARRQLPGVKIILSTWFFNEGEWQGLNKAFAQNKPFADCILAEGTTRPMPGGLPMVGFPEISMHETFPWGGFGATPLTRRAREQWDAVKQHVAGGFAYSEGIYEDITKAAISQFYWSDRPAEETLREYIAFEYSPEVVNEMLKVIATLEQNHHWRWWPGMLEGVKLDLNWFPSRGARPQADPGAEEAYATIRRVAATLTPQARQSWRWRQLYLRALLDAELKANGGAPNARCNEAFAELIEMYHARNANPAVRPPLPRQSASPVRDQAKPAAKCGPALQVVASDDSPNLRLPPDVPPVIGCWFWNSFDGEPENFKPFIDQVAKHSAYNLLTTSMRIGSRYFTDQDVHDAAKAAAAYARKHDIGIVLELPFVASFPKAYPEEILQQLRLQTVDLPEMGEAIVETTHPAGDNHLQGWPLRIGPARVARIYLYVRGKQGIEPETLRDITPACKVKEVTPTSIKVAIPCSEKTRGHQACVLFSIPWAWPDPFGPHLAEHHREQIGRYSDVDLAGVCLDEWGLPAFAKANELWYSPHWASAYAKRTQGRDLLRDMLLMVVGENGREADRQGAVNHYMEMTWQQNAAVENSFYRATKDIFGPSAFVGTHMTWQPYLNALEVRRNGWDWWASRRDYGQTDEVTPYCVRTALAKKWGKPVGYNMYYSTRRADYESELWCSALAGIRTNYHPIFPTPGHPRGWDYEALWQGGLMRGDCRVRLLNFISKSQLDCPVAVIFGHASALNWAGAGYADAGQVVADAFWKTGFYADLIPTSEIGSSALRVGDDGFVCYGKQKYAAVVLYHPEFERTTTGEFFRKAALGKTLLYRIGEWTRDFDGAAMDGNGALPPRMTAMADYRSCVERVAHELHGLDIEPHTPGTPAPPRAGRSRLIDGTIILTSGEKNPAGDPIRKTINVNGHKVTLDAVGVAAVRLSKDGKLEAMAAGGLKHFRVGSLDITLDQPADTALWREAGGPWQGVLQGYQGPVPETLAAITTNWLRLSVPVPQDNGNP